MNRDDQDPDYIDAPGAARHRTDVERDNWDLTPGPWYRTGDLIAELMGGQTAIPVQRSFDARADL